MLSVRPAHNALALRVTVTFDTARVMDVGAPAPAPGGDGDSDSDSGQTLTCMALTHDNVDAQFLAGVNGVPTIL